MRAITAFGRTQSLAAWARETRLSRYTIASRIADGMPAEEALTKPARAFDNEMWPGANELPYESDLTARLLLREHGPFTLVELSEMLGVCKQRVEQIEKRAMLNFVQAARDAGEDPDEMVEWLIERVRAADAREQTYPEPMSF